MVCGCGTLLDIDISGITIASQQVDKGMRTSGERSAASAAPASKSSLEGEQLSESRPLQGNTNQMQAPNHQTHTGRHQPKCLRIGWESCLEQWERYRARQIHRANTSQHKLGKWQVFNDACPCKRIAGPQKKHCGNGQCDQCRLQFPGFYRMDHSLTGSHKAVCGGTNCDTDEMGNSGGST